jgi:hypothetical protein
VASNIECSLNIKLERAWNEAGCLHLSHRTCLREMIMFVKNLILVGVRLIIKDRIYIEEFDLI